ncbi:MAG: beta-lactamase family protein [bacterium]|nr:beta-lactamase family protein [bacterium]
MKKSLLYCITILLLVTAENIYAQQEFPETPVGKKLQQLLDAFESDDHESFIDKNFADPTTKEQDLSFFRQIKMMHGGFTLHKIEESSDFRLRVIVKSKKRDAWRKIGLIVEQNSPHKISGWGIEMAQPPDDIPYTGPKFDLVSSLQPDADAVLNGEIGEKIDKHMTNIEERGYSGAILVASKGEIIIAKGYGYANRENKVPFQTSSAFDIGSITKQFTGAAILKLEMMGRLSVSDKITKYFENVPDDKNIITIHQLLTHSAGFPDGFGFDYSKITRDEYISLAFSKELLFNPGESYRYSNAGFSLLAAIIEIVTENSYEKFIIDQLFKPAGMNFTGYSLPEWKIDQVVHGYRGDDYFGQPNKKNWDDDGPWWHLRGNGGILSTIHDMYKWHLALDGEDILSGEAKMKYYTPHVLEGPGADTHYGYGWVIATSSRGKKVYMHNGGNPYFANDCYRYVEDDVFVYITSNNGAMSAIEQSVYILRMIFE